MPSIGLVCNLYNEAAALPGWLETHLPIFDDVRVLHSGPQGEYSNDGTLEILEKANVPVEFCAIDEGFGVVSTIAVLMSPCDWVMLLDADERFFPELWVLTCTGESTPPQEVDDLLYDYGNPNFDKDGPRNKQIMQGYDNSINFTACPSNFENMSLLGAKLRVDKSLYLPRFNHVKFLQEIIKEAHYVDAIKTIRRHWHDLTLTRPTQNWHENPDYQIRIIKNNGKIGWHTDSRMHERLIGATDIYQPNHTHGPFFDHFHLLFKKQEVMQRKHDIAVYNAIAEGKAPPTWQEFNN